MRAVLGSCRAGGDSVISASVVAVGAAAAASAAVETTDRYQQVNMYPENQTMFVKNVDSRTEQFHIA